MVKLIELHVVHTLEDEITEVMMSIKQIDQN